MRVRLMPAISLAVFSISSVFAQETRSGIFGRVTDSQNSVIPGAVLEVTNTDTNTAVKVTTNETGYYEANLLIAGKYRITVEKTGFSKLVRSGVELLMNQRVEINLPLQVGAVTETVAVTGEAPLVETSASASAGRVMEEREVLNLPTFNNSPLLLIKLAPGVNSSNVRRYNGVNAVGGTAEAHIEGNVGTNDWYIDGQPNMGTGAQAASLPYSTTIAEYKVATQNFDASVGHTAGLSVSVMTKAGTNSYHGDLTEQYWNMRWNGAPFFVRKAHYAAIAQANAAGNTALAQSIANSPVNPPGHSNTWAATLGGPVIIPRLINGRNKLFFFADLDGFTDRKPTNNTFTHTVPTMPERSGDFSDLLKVSASKYQLYDPLTVRSDPSRAGHYIRSPIPGNIIPQSRMVNPLYKTYVAFEPIPNSPPASANLEPLNNYLDPAEPYNWDYISATTRVDYQASQKHRFYGRWSWLKYREHSGDWTYETKPGLMIYGYNRNNLAAMLNWVYTPTSRTVLDAQVAFNDYRDANLLTDVALGYTPSSVGLPKYMDAKAGSAHALPVSSFSGYDTLGQTVPAWVYFESFNAKSDLTYIRGNHSFNAGMDARDHRRLNASPGLINGSFAFTNRYTCQQDDCLTAGSIGHSWASFLMGLPATSSTDTNDSYATSNPYVGWFVQDNWRAFPKLSLNFGLRMEYEFGLKERYDRIIAGFDPGVTLPITAMAQAAYAKSPVPELPASSFAILGGSVYAGVGGVDRRFPAGQFMLLPRFGFSYQLSPQFAVRGGYGVYYDTLNAQNQAPDQSGFSQSTSVSTSNDFGQTWVSGNPANGVSPLVDPFPLRSDGSRYDTPLRSAIGVLARTGSGWTSLDPNYRRARSQRWRLEIQRQFGPKMALLVGYSGMYSSNVRLNRKLDILPAQYWNYTNTRNNAIATNLNSNVANPFYITNFAALQSSSPALYQALASRSFFTSATIRKNQLLRPFPQMNGLNRTGGNGEAKTESVDVVFRRSFGQGFMLNAMFSALAERDRDYFYREFDPNPSWEMSNNGTPWKIAITGIWELPFGRGKWLAQRGVANAVLGGWQLSAVYENQPGPLLTWGNVFFSGDMDKICGGWTQTPDRWFNTAGFVSDTTQTPTSFQAPVFPRRVGGCRADGLNRLDTNLQRTFKLTERMTFQLRLDALNALNRSQLAGPSVDPTSTNFGKVTNNTQTTNRWLEIQGRIHF